VSLIQATATANPESGLQRRAEHGAPVSNPQTAGLEPFYSLGFRGFAEIMRSSHSGFLPHNPEPDSDPGFRNLKVTSKGVGSYPCSIWTSGVSKGWRPYNRRSSADKTF
jgi:hypothetical protein